MLKTPSVAEKDSTRQTHGFLSVKRGAVAKCSIRCSFSILISCDNSDEYFTLAQCGMWVASRKRGLAGSCHKYLFFAGFNGYALLGLVCTCAFMVTGPRKARRPKAGCCFQEKFLLFISSVSVGFCVCVKSHAESSNM